MTSYAAVVLAAGLGRRYQAAGGSHPTKLVADLGGEPVVRWAVRAALASCACPLIVVTGHEHEAVSAALAGLDVSIVQNPHYGSGMASTLKVGMAAVPRSCAGAVVLLGDMPAIDPETIDSIVRAAEADVDAQAVVATHGGVRGNPVLIKRPLFPAIENLQGDTGARSLLRDPGIRVREVQCAKSVTMDIDEPDDLARASLNAEGRAK